MNWLKTIRAKWTIIGILFGLLFPIAGTLLKIELLGKSFSINSFIQAQTGEQVLWIVDLAPLILGTVFTFIGKREYELQQSTDLLTKTNQQLSELRTHLEQLVEERTVELAIASEQATERANQLSTIADLTQSLATITNFESLLWQITLSVSQHMGYYHIGIFLLEDAGEYAVLKAANSEGGQKMLARGHRLRVGSEGLVGFVAARGITRIALDVGADTVYFNNPDLPDTRSEVALPLRFGEMVIGVLDIQSIELNAISSYDLTVLKVLANQLAIVIQNVRSLEQAQIATARAEAAVRQLTRQSWSKIKSNTPITSYWFDGDQPQPLTQPKNGGPREGQKDVFSIPIELRGETIGGLRIKHPIEGRQWAEDEIEIIQATAERLALALENARLLEASLKRAAKEQIIGEISTKISSSINLSNVFQTAVEELGRNIPGSEIVIELKNKSQNFSPGEIK